MTSGQLAAQRHHGAAHGERVPTGLDAHVDVDALASRGLREAEHPVLGEEVAHMARRLANHVERDAGRGIEVDPHLVGILWRRRAERPHVQPEYTHVHRPQHVGQVGDHEGSRRGAIDGLDRGRRANPGPSRGSASGRTTSRARRSDTAPTAPDGRERSASERHRPPGSSGRGRASSGPPWPGRPMGT